MIDTCEVDYIQQYEDVETIKGTSKGSNPHSCLEQSITLLHKKHRELHFLRQSRRCHKYIVLCRSSLAVFAGRDTGKPGWSRKNLFYNYKVK